MDIVSFETAKKLKEAGFPKPNPLIGFFYVESETPITKIKRKWKGLIFLSYYKWSLIGSSDGGAPLFSPHGRWNEFLECDSIFAPTAADILRQLPDHHIVFDNLYNPPGFSCFDKMETTNRFIFTHENAAEAAALAWLSFHQVQL